MSENLNQTVIEPFEVGAATFGDGRLTLIAGPCVVESRAHVLFMARECQQRARDANRYKAENTLRDLRRRLAREGRGNQ